MTQLSDREDSLVLCLSASDGFGTYGIVGVAIAFINTEEVIIDTLLLSCRILGRMIETAFLVKIIELATEKNSNIKTCHARYIPTQKNEITHAFLKEHGFETHDGESQYYTLTDFGKLRFPEHINFIGNMLTP